MKRFIPHPSSLIPLLLLCLAPAYADFSGLPDGVKSNVSAIKKYPKASSILLWVKDAYTQNSDGSQVYERHEFRYIADEAGRDTWGDPRISYDDNRQKVDVITARTYTSDGRTIDITPNALNPVFPDELDHAPDFANYRQLVVTLLGLENGCVSELHYKVTTHGDEVTPSPLWLWGRVYLREEVPTIARELTVKLPAGKSLVYKAENGAGEPLITGSTYVWRMAEQPGYAADDLRGHRVLLPSVAFTTAKDWAEVADYFEGGVSFNWADLELPESLRAMMAGTTEPENQLDSIKSWVRERYTVLSFDHPDFELAMRPTFQILERGYGNSVDMAILVARLASKAGLKAWPRAWFEFTPPVPYLYDLTGALVELMTPADTILTDPVAPRNEFPLSELADSSILYPTVKGKSLLRRGADWNIGELRLSLVIDALNPDTLKGSGTLFASGLLAPYETLRTDPKAQLEHLISLSGFALQDAAVKQLQPGNCVVDFTFSISGLDTVDGHHPLTLSAVDLAQFAGNPNFNLEKKEFPHYVKLPGTITVHLEAPIPDKWNVAQQPADINRKWADGSGTRTIQVTDNRLIVDETLTLGSAWIQPSDWPEFRSFLIETGNRPNNIIVFK